MTNENKLNAADILNYERLDIIVKSLFAKSILRRDPSDKEKSLYARHIIMRTFGLEPINKYGDSEKASIDDYLDQFPELIESIQSEGFDKSKPVLVGKDGALLNGAHRLSVGLALDEDVYIETLERTGKAWDFEWFKDSGFNNQDLMRILKGYFEAKPENCSIVTVWKPAYKYIGEIKTILSSNFNIVGEIEHCFENNFMAFRNIVLDIYHPNKSRQSKETQQTILNKIRMLEADKLEFKVFLLEEKEHSDIHSVKRVVRHYLKNDINDKIYASIHASDSQKETEHLVKTLLCPNNIEHLDMRLSYDVSEEFKEWCEELKATCEKNNIDLDDVCVVGSAPMTVIGIKDVSDIDITVKTKYRPRFGDKPFPISDNIDIVSLQYHRTGDAGTQISDDNLIDNSDHHFRFMGLKFANLSILKDRKAFSAREKDLRHVRNIELFERMHGHSLQQRVLVSRFKEEEIRRRNKKKVSFSRRVKRKLGVSKK